MKLLIFLTVVYLFVPWSWAQSSKDSQASLRGGTPLKVAILPVIIHSPEDLAYMREGLWDMLSSRVELEGRVNVLEKGVVKKALAQISGEMDSESARKVGRLLEADYVVYGSLTKLGDSASLDLKVLEVKEEKAASSVFVQAKKMEEIVARVDDLSRKVDEKILGYSLSPPVEKPVVAEKAGEPAQMAGIPAPPPGFRSMVPAKPEGMGQAPAGFWQSTSFPFKVKGMAMGDLDGDGRNEIALIDDRNLWIYRYENEFKLLKKFEGGSKVQYLAVDVADIKKEGKAQVFVTSLQGDEAEWSPRPLASFVVSYRDGDYRIVNPNLDWFLRVVNWGEKGAVLLGQRRGLKTSFEESIYELGWNGKGYKEVRKLGLSKVFSIYGFTPFVYKGTLFYAFIDSDSRLKVLDGKGKVIWRGVTNYGSDNDFRVKPIQTSLYYEGDDIAPINVRLIPRGEEILILKNLSPVGDLFKRQKVFTGGEVQSLIWNGAMFMERWKSQEISGYLADFQTQQTVGAAGNELILAVNLPRESILSGGAGSALMVGRIQ